MADREYINTLLKILELIDNTLVEYRGAYNITNFYWASETKQRLWLSKCISALSNDYYMLDDAIKYYSFETTEVLYGNPDIQEPTSDSKKRIAELVNTYNNHPGNFITSAYMDVFIKLKNIVMEE